MFTLNPALKTIDSTKLKSMQMCPRGFFIEHVLGLRKPSYHLVFGKAYHEAMEHLMLHEYSPENTKIAQGKFVDSYMKDFGSANPEGLIPAKSLARGIDAIEQYAALYKDDYKKFKVLVVEQASTFTLDGNLGKEAKTIAFKIDAVVLDESTNTIWALDHKTASQEGWTYEARWKNDIQMAIYTYAIQKFFGDKYKVGGAIINTTFFKAKTTDFKRYYIHHDKESLTRVMLQVKATYREMLYELATFSAESKDDPYQQSFTCRNETCSIYGCKHRDLCGMNNLGILADMTPMGYERYYWNVLDELKDQTKVTTAVVNGTEVSYIEPENLK